MFARAAGFAALLLTLAGVPGQSEPPPTSKSGQLDLEIHELRPGLAAHYHSLVDDSAILDRVDAKPAFTLGHSTPHPRLPPGPFEVEWTGVLFVADRGPVQFDAFVSGELTVEVDGQVVLNGRGERDSAHLGPGAGLNRDRGYYRFRVRYHSLPDAPARLQIGWQGPTFAREPLPAWYLKHIPTELPAAFQREELIEHGRHAVGRFGCVRCHSTAFPGVNEPPPGPALADAGQRISRDWLLEWLDNPAKMRADAHMPALFAPDRVGFVERWLIADYLLGPGAKERSPPEPAGDHRVGRRRFVELGCAACHFLPESQPTDQPALGQTPLSGLSDRLPAVALAAFLGNPHARYPDGRMPRLPVTPETARDIAAYLLLWFKPFTTDAKAPPPTAPEIADVLRRIGASRDTVAAALVREKRCTACHPGLGATTPAAIPIAAIDGSRGCLSGKTLPRFAFDDATKKTIAAFQGIAPRETHPSAFAEGQRLIERLGCVHCHQRDSDRAPPIEAIGSTLGSGWLENVPYQRTPRLTAPVQKYTRSHLLSAIREGVSGLRAAVYTYRMPAFGHDAEAIVRALAEADGEPDAESEPSATTTGDPTLGTLAGASLVGFQGYSCVSCHVWNGRVLSGPDPGAVGTDLTRVAGRIRREWFDRFLEGPMRSHPGTPMPSVFNRGEKALLTSILDGDPARQKEAMWAYLALGKQAPSPKPPPPLPITTPKAGEPILVAQIPVRTPELKTIEGICLLDSSNNLVIYDVELLSLHSVWTGARLFRGVQGRLRTITSVGKPAMSGFIVNRPIQLEASGKLESFAETLFAGYDRFDDGVRIRWRARFSAGTVDVAETLRIVINANKRWLHRELHFAGIPAESSVVFRTRFPEGANFKVQSSAGAVDMDPAPETSTSKLPANGNHEASISIDYEVSPLSAPPSLEPFARPDETKISGSLERSGYRAIAYPRPKTISGEDRVMPSAIAVNPKDGRVFVASMKTGELLVVNDPTDDGRNARFEDYTHGLFQETLAMLADPDALYVLHRRNLTRIPYAAGSGPATRFDRVAALTNGIADTYDYAYGLVRDRDGAFVYSYAQYSNAGMPGAGNALRLIPGQKPQEFAYGFRNPLGWCVGPGGDVFFTDNQGEWVATNKLSHLVAGRYYGFPNPAQRQHVTKSPTRPAVWVPYGWAHSLNGVTYDNTGGKFGPFDGQFFLAELMFGGAIIRADVEKVNGEYQGCCFPFWGNGLLGPLCLAFDPKGRLWVGGITEPGWMAQPDRGALFRIAYTGRVPFEMRSIHARPHGFRIDFTAPVDPASARNPASYRIEHYRYEYTGAYGSPELDRTAVRIEHAELSPDGLSVELTTAPLIKDRVYSFTVGAVKSAKGEPLVHPIGAYTMNEIPQEPR